MNYACYNYPGGELVTPQEFIKRATPDYKNKGIFPYCEACGERVDLYGVHNHNGPSRFDHPNLPAEANPLDDCVLANRNKRFRGMQPSGFDLKHGQQLREEFYKITFIKKTYHFMWALCGRNNFPISKFESILKRAEKKKIWAYKDIMLWTIPYILLTFENFKYTSGIEFHFYIDKNKTTFINEIWNHPGKTFLCKVFSDTTKLIKSSHYNPLSINKDNFEKISQDYNFIKDEQLSNILKLI